MQPLSVQQAASRLGVHPDTVRRWESQGKLVASRLGNRRDRRFAVAEIDAFAGKRGSPKRGSRVALYVRVSGRGDQLSSLVAQEQELRGQLLPRQEVSKVYSDVGSGLNEKRRGLLAALAAAKAGRFDELHVTHPDRLTRFGDDMLRELFLSYGVSLFILHKSDQETPEQELMADFMALITSFSGRLYGQRSAAAKRRLLKEASK